MASLIQIAMKLVSTFTPPPYSARRSASPVIQLQSEAVGQAGEVIEQAPDVGLFIAEWCGLEPV